MRWNNLGIGYLDQLQYDDAMDAFEQVVRLRPDYKDGYINLGVTYIEWEKYAKPARHWRRRWHFIPMTRARSTIWRWSSAGSGIPKRRSPTCKRSSRSIRNRATPAASSASPITSSIAPKKRWQQFKALQAIDPDDLAAHYNLAILYRRMGMKQQAAREAALYAIKRVDPGRAHLFARLSAQAS